MREKEAKKYYRGTKEKKLYFTVGNKIVLLQRVTALWESYNLRSKRLKVINGLCYMGKIPWLSPLSKFINSLVDYSLIADEVNISISGIFRGLI